MSNAKVLALVRRELEGEEYSAELEKISLEDVIYEDECEEDQTHTGTEVTGAQVWYINTSKCDVALDIRVYLLGEEIFISRSFENDFPDDICIPATAM